ncbi:hypothetical protein BGW37DRAFT_467639 [Umbelopsis sp. PMI_123]|nr:hypothetical protein BGW37DRAFT_467639 [Umbelopsis sp. PMI_123]
MPTIINCAHIAQAITKTMIYRTCAECEGKLTVVFVNSSGKREANEFYCKKCCQFAVSLKAAYRLQFTIVNSIDDSVENLIAFDEAIMPLIGCPASEFDELAVQHPDLYDITETVLVGMCCEITLRDGSRPNKVGHLKPDRIVESITPLQQFVPIISSTMTSRYWQDNSLDDLIDSNTKVDYPILHVQAREIQNNCNMISIVWI